VKQLLVGNQKYMVMVKVTEQALTLRVMVEEMSQCIPRACHASL